MDIFFGATSQKDFAIKQGLFFFIKHDLRVPEVSWRAHPVGDEAHLRYMKNEVALTGYEALLRNMKNEKYALRFIFCEKMLRVGEANETGYWLELLFKTNYINENQYKQLDTACAGLRAMLIASINTAKENAK